MSVAAAADRLAAILDEAPGRLAAVSSEGAGPGRWSPKEILGHLIDSAGNNHQRFVRAQIFPSVADPGYDQDNWVAVQNYAAEPWPDLIQLWLLFNRHLLHVMRTVREDALDTPTSIRGAAPVPLSHVMIDYVRHLERHLEQIAPLY
jgi:DinB superfamily